MDDLVQLTVQTRGGKPASYTIEREIAEEQIKNLYKRGLIIGAFIQEATDEQKETYRKEATV